MTELPRYLISHISTVKMSAFIMRNLRRLVIHREETFLAYIMRCTNCSVFVRIITTQILYNKWMKGNFATHYNKTLWYMGVTCIKSCALYDNSCLFHYTWFPATLYFYLTRFFITVRTEISGFILQIVFRIKEIRLNPLKPSGNYMSQLSNNL
jgi:hypothetical protein